MTGSPESKQASIAAMISAASGPQYTSTAGTPGGIWPTVSMASSLSASTMWPRPRNNPVAGIASSPGPICVATGLRRSTLTDTRQPPMMSSARDDGLSQAPGASETIPVVDQRLRQVSAIG